MLRFIVNTSMPNNLTPVCSLAPLKITFIDLSDDFTNNLDYRTCIKHFGEQFENYSHYIWGEKIKKIIVKNVWAILVFKHY